MTDERKKEIIEELAKAFDELEKIKKLLMEIGKELTA